MKHRLNFLYVFSQALNKAVEKVRRRTRICVVCPDGDYPEQVGKRKSLNEKLFLGCLLLVNLHV